jgi:tRNA A-37 threonylcarbamoyl transferase component Bud32
MAIPNGNAHKPAAFTAFTDKGIQWIADPSCVHLISPALHALLYPEASGECRLIRENKVRRSMLIRVPRTREVVFAKLYKRPVGADRFKYFLLPSKASAEWKALFSFYARGLPVPDPLARGERRKGGFLQEAYLFTRALEGAIPISEIGSGHDAFVRHTMLTTTTARLIAQMHNAGFFFRDLHAGNILIVPGTNAPDRIYLVDLHKVWHTGWVPMWMRTRDLAQLRNSLGTSRTVQLRFLRSYLLRANLPAVSLRQVARRMDRTAGRLWSTHLSSRTKRCLTESSEFSICTRGTTTIYRNRAYPEPLIDALLNRYHQPPQDNPLILKKTAKETVSVLRAEPGGGAYKVVIKEAIFASLFSRLRNTLFRSRARRSWVGARALRVRGISTPDALALLEYREGMVLCRTILITRYVDRSQELNDYVLMRYNHTLSAEESRHKKRFIAALAGLIREMHARGIYHADLKSNNILVVEEGDAWNLHVVDLDRIRCGARLSFEERANNLAQINASVAACITPADRILFFRQYAHGTPIAGEGKRYFSRIMAIGQTKNTGPYGLVFKGQ